MRNPTLRYPLLGAVSVLQEHGKCAASADCLCDSPDVHSCRLRALWNFKAFVLHQSPASSAHKHALLAKGGLVGGGAHG